VIVSEGELLNRITEDVKSRMKPYEPLSIKMIRKNNKGDKEPTVKANSEFQYHQLLIECLLGMEPNETDKNELLTICKTEFEDNNGELGRIDEFQCHYSSDKILWWYTRHSFFDQLLNRALNDEHIHMMFLFRSFLADMHRLLQQHQSTATRHVYRGQWVTEGELENLKQAMGQLILIRSFVLASGDRHEALTYCKMSDDTSGLQQVLFEIDADPKEAGTMQPFADLTVHNDMSSSRELLFMFGSTFHLLSIDRDKNEIWIVRMTLSSDNDFKSISRSIEEPTGSVSASFQRLAKILWRMGQFDLAEKYYQCFLNELNASDPLRYSIYDDLSRITAQKGDQGASAQWLAMAMLSEQKTTTEDDCLDQVLDCKSKWKLIEKFF
jgi:hypothetical protein